MDFIVCDSTGDISIHAAREGGDTYSRLPLWSISSFQSTPPVKAATTTQQRMICQPPFQSTPPVKAATNGGLSINLIQ